MNLTLKVSSVMLIFYLFVLSCSNDPITNQAVIQPINPNGDSELALHMRAMFDEVLAIKQQILKGEKATFKLDQDKLLKAHATEPEKVASPTYKAFAQSYLQAVKELKNAPAGQRMDKYENLVSNCMSCHQALCPGPIVKIKKL